jgi:hypothetical protein
VYNLVLGEPNSLSSVALPIERAQVESQPQSIIKHLKIYFTFTTWQLSSSLDEWLTHKTPFSFAAPKKYV